MRSGQSAIYSYLALERICAGDVAVGDDQRLNRHGLARPTGESQVGFKVQGVGLQVGKWSQWGVSASTDMDLRF